VGVLVQSNFGGDLMILGVPVGRLLGRKEVSPTPDPQGPRGSIMIVVATDAPIGPRNLGRLASRAIMGLARTGSVASNGAGDYVIAFSTHPSVRRTEGATRIATSEIGNDAMTPLFQAVVEATEEAIYNSRFAATTMKSRGGTVEALPVADVVKLLQARGALR
jgi:D-aminopeptidase